MHSICVYRNKPSLIDTVLVFYQGFATTNCSRNVRNMSIFNYLFFKKVKNFTLFWFLLIITAPHEHQSATT